jgi:putative oxidoreductase
MKREDALWNAGDLVGRVLLGQLFVLEAISKIGEYEDAGSYMAAFGIPAILLPAAIALEFGAGVMIMIGWRTRWAAAALAAFCAFVAVVFHYDVSDRNQVIHLEKDLALAGAFLVVWARGAGALSIDGWGAHRRGKRDGATIAATSLSGE